MKIAGDEAGMETLIASEPLNLAFTEQFDVCRHLLVAVASNDEHDGAK